MIIFIFIINSDFHFSTCFLMILTMLSNSISKKSFTNCVICEALICLNFTIIMIFSSVYFFFLSSFLLHSILKRCSSSHILNSFNFWTSTKWNHFNVLTTRKLINTLILRLLMLFFIIISLISDINNWFRLFWILRFLRRRFSIFFSSYLIISVFYFLISRFMRA